METDIKKVFVSYSWDDEKHQRWVMNLVNLLRENGIDATFDKFETQSVTVNLYYMMISNIKDKDYIIVVLTENYAKKANELQGGVGFETLLTFPLLTKESNKLIFIVRDNGNFEDVFPFHLKGWHAIDFSDDSKFSESFKELLHRIEGVPLYEKAPLGSKPKLIPISMYNENGANEFTDFNIPNLKNITDLDKERFIVKNFHEINELFTEFFSQIKYKNDNFTFVAENTSNKYIYKLYVNGSIKTTMKIWLSDDFRTKSIKLAFGNHIRMNYDNSYNECIVCEVNENKEMFLKMTMNILGNKNANDPRSIVKEIWQNNLSHYFN